jgi:predicted MFS family arabinose efflux permease
MLNENEGMPARLLWTLAIAAGISVANIYYNQPLLNLLCTDLHISDLQANMIPVTTQIGYAAGLLFIIPLGDLVRRKNIVLTSFTVLILSLLCIALTRNYHVILAASFLTGTCSVMPQIFIPIAARYSTPATKERNVGFILSGLLTGILASRVVSGVTGEYFGWRFIFFAAAAAMLCCLLLMACLLPDIAPTFEGSYSRLMRSIGTLIRQYRQLRINSLRSGFAFGSFLALWSCLAFKMAGAPFFAGNDVVGLLGLCGIAGALTASSIGPWIRKWGVTRFHYIGTTLQLLAWAILFVGAGSYAGLIAGIVIIDIGMQCIQLSNQSAIFSLCPEASNRVNTVFMTTYFIGGSLGTFLAGLGWKLMAWNGVVAVGALLTAVSLLITLADTKRG